MGRLARFIRFYTRSHRGDNPPIPDVYTEFSGSIVQFTAPKAHTFKSFSFTVDPVQDLHGQSSPYPAGGGVQKFNKDTATDGKYVNANGAEITAANYGHSEIIAVEPNTTYYMSGYGGSGIYAILALDGDGNTIPTWYGGASKTAAFTATTPAACQYVILNYYVEQKNTVLFKVSDGNTNYSPYENLSPISGWNSATVTGAGKNLLNWEYTSIGPLPTRFNGFGNSKWQPRMEVPKMMRGQTFTYSVYFNNTTETNETAKCGTYYYDKNLTLIGTNNGNSISPNTSGISSVTFTIPDSAVYYALGLFLPVGAVGENPQLEYAATATSYESPSIRTLTLSFGETLYNADVEYKGGGLWDVTPKSAIVDLGTLSWVRVNGAEGIRIWKGNLSDAKEAKTIYGLRNAICSQYKLATSGMVMHSGDEDCVFLINSNYLGAQGYVYIRDTEYDAYTGADFKAAMNGVQLVYELANPTTFTVTTEELFNALKGENNIWTDCGITTLEAIGEAIELNALQSLNILLGGRYVNNHTADDVSDEEALNIILGGNNT